MTYPGPVNGDRLAFEIEHADTPPQERPDWPLPSFDAREWGAAFCATAAKLGYRDAEGRPIDEEWAQSWFANALMRGYDEGMSNARPRLRPHRQLESEPDHGGERATEAK